MMAENLARAPALGERARNEIAHRAATLDERLALVERSGIDPPRETSPHEPAKGVLAPWVQAFSAGDREAFERRLRWDGLDVDTVLHALAADPGSEPPPWTSWLDRILEESSRFARERASQVGEEPAEFPEARYFGPDGELPFLELWVPVLRAARRVLHARNGDLQTELAPPAWGALQRQLARELSLYAELALYERFSDLRTGRLPERSDLGQRAAYSTFVDEMLDGGWVSLLQQYPVLARQLARLCETWMESAAELVERLRLDRAALSESFDSGRELGPVEAIETGISDRHDRGRRVLVLCFRSGLRLVYKPRDVGLEHAYNDLLVWLRRAGLEGAPRPLRILEREDYGWVEFVAPGHFPDRDAVRRYFRMSGRLICITYVLRGRDLHLENVVASAEGPVLVDTEMLMQPAVSAEASAGSPVPGRRADDWVQESCLGTGLLTLLETDPKGVLFDLGGLRGRGGAEAPLALRQWRALGTDFLHYDRNASFTPRLTNHVVREGVLESPGDYTEDILSGFEETYRFFLANRDAILAPQGPLSTFARERVRVLLRTSTQYGALLYVLAAPRYQRAGIHRSFASDALNRVFSPMRERPLLWPMMADERESIENLDIPRFVIGVTDKTLCSKRGERVESYLSCAGLDTVRERVSELSEKGLDEQREILRRALSSWLDSRFHVDLIPGDRKDGSSRADPSPTLLDHALWIGRELLERAIPEGDSGLGWRLPATLGDAAFRNGFASVDLYDGAAGVALFFAALSVVSLDRSWGDAARAALSPLRKLLDDEGPGDKLNHAAVGGCSGLGSLVYTAASIGRLLDDPNAREMALRVARRIDEPAIASDERLDVVAGSAGAILSLLALHLLEPEETWVLERARRCGRRLLEERVEPAPGLVAWDLDVAAGLAHGAAGMAYALARLFVATEDRRFLEAAAGAYRYERTLFSPRYNNWPILKGGVATEDRGAAVMTAWCHGAPGIGLARALALDALSDADVLQEIDVAMTTTASWPSLHSDHLCCGNLGRADALLTVGRAVDRPDLIAAAEAVTRFVAERARERGHFGLPATAFEYPTFVPGFFKGLSGIGYQLLRVAAPERLPSILGFEV